MNARNTNSSTARCAPARCDGEFSQGRNSVLVLNFVSRFMCSAPRY